MVVEGLCKLPGRAMLGGIGNSVGGLSCADDDDDDDDDAMVSVRSDEGGLD